MSLIFVGLTYVFSATTMLSASAWAGTRNWTVLSESQDEEEDNGHDRDCGYADHGVRHSVEN